MVSMNINIATKLIAKFIGLWSEVQIINLERNISRWEKVYHGGKAIEKITTCNCCQAKMGDTNQRNFLKVQISEELSSQPHLKKHFYNGLRNQRLNLNHH